MTVLDRSAAPTSVTPARPRWAVAGGLAIGATVIGVSLPNVAGGDVGAMTHYMGLLAANQPWNLVLFMAIPVILAETLAITELVVLFTQGRSAPWVLRLNRWAGLIAGPWFLVITVYLLKNAVVPLTVGAGWHGPADLVAVGFYLLGVVPLVGITCIELDILGRKGPRSRMKLHATFVGIFLVAALFIAYSSAGRRDARPDAARLAAHSHHAWRAGNGGHGHVSLRGGRSAAGW